MITYLLDPAHWAGSDGILVLTGQHLVYSMIALFAAAVIAIPLGLYIGHTGKGEFVVAALANSLRALPSVGLLILMVMIFSPLFASRMAFIVPSLIVLVLLAVPPILTSTYAGVMAVDWSAVDAARGMGFTPGGVLRQVEIPCALPLMLSGIRSALLQIISTAIVAAYVSLGGLGRLLIDGRAQNDYEQMAAGALLVALLALIVELIMTSATKRMVSPGLSRRQLKTRIRRAAPAPQSTFS